MFRLASFVAASITAALLSACVFAPPSNTPADTNAVARMSEHAVSACGAGNVKEVNAKSFTCK
ncbi:hypothetical protein ACS5PN_14880 [Roseateles sp. NT4]|uniref:hypothetical protein n=1 Tax=Roseateles sp. NT4 TaxID=3453715 RepID=UPI003EEAA1A8